MLHIQTQGVLRMKKHKTNNLLAYGKKAALLAMFVTLPLSNVNAAKEVPVSQEQQIEQKTENKKDADSPNNLHALWILIVPCVVWWSFMLVDSIKHPEKWRGLERGFCPSSKSKQR